MPSSADSVVLLFFGWLTAHRSHTTPSCPPGETPGESPEQMSARVDRVIARVRAIHAEATAESSDPNVVQHSDVIIFSHGHFTRAFIARWCDFPIAAGYHFAADAGGLAVLGYQHSSLDEPCEWW